MSSHGWSGEGLGEEASEGLSGWAPPLEAGTPPPAEIREDEDEEHAEGSAEGDARRGRLGAVQTRFLARLARQPAPNEEPAPARMTASETAEAVTSTPRARQRDTFSFDASRPSLPLVRDTQGEVPTVTPAGAAFDTRGTTRHTSPRVVERHGVSRTLYLEGGTPRRQGGTPARASEAPTRRAGTPTSDSALQEMLVDTFSRALQRLSASAGTPTRTPRPTGVRPVSHPVSASSGNAFVDQTRP
ncbi:hypothetical protein F441_09711, partial [Phytophthora nicotianae CJ01A1]